MTAWVDSSGSSQARQPSPLIAAIPSWSAAFSDLDEQAACVSSVFPQSYEQLDCGRFAGEMASVDFGGVLIVRERVNRRLLQTGLVTSTSLLWAWQKSKSYRTNGVEHADDCMYFYRANEDFDILCDPSELVAISISNQVLEEWFGHPMDAATSRLFSGPRQVPDDVAHSLRRAISTALVIADRHAGTDFVPDELWRGSVRDKLLRAVTSVAELPGRGAREVRRCERTYERVVRAARQFALQNASKELNLQDVYSHVGVSRRNLHYAFDAVMGISPGQYLRSLRLNAARRDIERGEPATLSLADIAAHWGFWHPSHFTADYKRRFGELPSETARRAALRSASALLQRPGGS